MPEPVRRIPLPYDEAVRTLSCRHERHRRKRFEELLRLCGYLRESRLRPVLEKLLPVLARSAGIQLEDADLSFPPLWTPTAKETADIAKIKADSIVSAFQSGLLDVPAAQQELRRLSDETGMFGSITDEAIAANAGKTYQDVTAMRDPLAGLTEI